MLSRKYIIDKLFKIDARSIRKLKFGKFKKKGNHSWGWAKKTRARKGLKLIGTEGRG